MLRTIKVLDGAEVPVIGINVGLLGYLTEIEPPAMTAALDRFLVGDFTLERRMMLTVTVDRVGERGRGTVDGAERSRAREAGERPHRAIARRHRRGAVHLVRR